MRYFQPFRRTTSRRQSSQAAAIRCAWRKPWVRVILGLIIVSLWSRTSFTQTFVDCADVTGDGRLSVADVVAEWNEHLGFAPIPAGKGDIDLRAGYTIFDTRWLYSYIFAGWPEGACPPHPSFAISPGPDTVFLPTATFPAGSGDLALPIILKNPNKVIDLLLPLKVSGLDPTVSLDSISISPLSIGEFFKSAIFDSTAVLLISESHSDKIHVFGPGVHHIATVHLHYEASPGGTITLDTAQLSNHTFPHYVYGNALWIFNPDDWTVAQPAIVVTQTVDLFPTMSAAPNTLFFEALAGNPNPAPQSFTIETDGAPFAWTLTAPAWIGVDKTSGISGEPVQVSPDISGLLIQLHTGMIVVESEALGSPINVVVQLNVMPAFPSLDANCDGMQNAPDIIVLVNYIFKSGAIPCNPCTGEH